MVSAKARRQRQTLPQILPPRLDSKPWQFRDTPDQPAGCAPPGQLQAIDFRGENGAKKGTRTPDLLITNQLLYQLSYLGSSLNAAAEQTVAFSVNLSQHRLACSPARQAYYPTQPGRVKADIATSCSAASRKSQTDNRNHKPKSQMAASAEALRSIVGPTGPRGAKRSHCPGCRASRSAWSMVSASLEPLGARNRGLKTRTPALARTTRPRCPTTSMPRRRSRFGRPQRSLRGPRRW